MGIFHKSDLEYSQDKQRRHCSSLATLQILDSIGLAR